MDRERWWLIIAQVCTRSARSCAAPCVPAPTHPRLSSAAGAVVSYVTVYSTLLVVATRRMMRGDPRSARSAEKALRLFLGSLSVEERIAEARAYAVAAAIRNAPPGEDLTLQVGTAEDPDVIELSRHRRRASS